MWSSSYHPHPLGAFQLASASTEAEIMPHRTPVENKSLYRYISLYLQTWTPHVAID